MPAPDPARNLADDVRQLVEMPRGDFENLVADLYRALGHQAACTGEKSENAVHVMVQAKNGERWVVQVRQWRGAVGELVVRDFYAAVLREGATQGAIITTASFTPKAREWAKDKPLHLYDGPEFLRAMKRIHERAAELARRTQPLSGTAEP